MGYRVSSKKGRHHLITKNQSGFRSGDSTTNQLIDLVDEIHLHEITRSSCSISRYLQGFRQGVASPFKMRQNAISGKLLKLFQNYLSNRKQRVVLNGFSSDYPSIESGVPPGSFLGPLLFLIYINVLEKNIKSNVNFLLMILCSFL